MQYQSTVYISLGSNIDPLANLNSARDALFSAFDNGQISPVYQSSAVGMIGPDFLNAVVGATTALSVEEVVRKLYEIERNHGRIRTSNKFSDRTLDLDLLLYDAHIQNTESPDNDDSIVLPHPEILQQAYVLQPLADIAGDLVHPICGVTTNELLMSLKSRAPEKFSSLVVVSTAS